MRADAFDADRPGGGELARQAGRRWLAAAAALLVEETAIDRPVETTVRFTGGTVRVRSSDPDLGDLTSAPSRIRASRVPDTRRRQITIGFAVAGAVLLLAMVGWPNVLAVLAVLAGIGLLVASGCAPTVIAGSRPAGSRGRKTRSCGSSATWRGRPERLRISIARSPSSSGGLLPILRPSAPASAPDALACAGWRDG
jgi:hypothetical protein